MPGCREVGGTEDEETKMDKYKVERYAKISDGCKRTDRPQRPYTSRSRRIHGCDAEDREVNTIAANESRRRKSINVRIEDVKEAETKDGIEDTKNVERTKIWG